MRDVQIFISNGSDTNRYRDVAADVLDRLRQVLHFELRYEVTISNWDYRRASPELVPVGSLGAMSLNVVDRSHALIAIFGRRCPTITCDEIRRAFERRAREEPIGVFIFVNPRLVTDEHRGFFDELGQTFGFEPLWTRYTDRMSFQAVVFTTLMRFLLEHLEISNPRLLQGAA